MHRFFLEGKYRGETLTLTGREAKHAVQVLRLRRGDLCVVLNGGGEEWRCEVESVAKQAVELKVIERRLHDPAPHRVTLFQALPKGKLIETILQKATELGVERVVPVLTQRVVTQLDEEAAVARGERWKQTAIEAIKQCGTPWLPEILAPLDFKSVLPQMSQQELTLVASLQSDRRQVREVVGEFVTRHGRKPLTVGLWIGPEGDFTPEELSTLRLAGAQAISLGRNVLRADTAAIAGIAILQYELALEQD